MRQRPKPIAMVAHEARARGEKRRRFVSAAEAKDTELLVQVGEPLTRPRRPSDDPRPFCWSSCAALRAMEKAFEAGGLAIARAVYSTLCQIAADRNEEVFQYPQRDLATRAGVSVRTLRDTLKRLEACNLLTFYHTSAPDNPLAMGENVYRLLSAKRGNNDQPYVYSKNGEPIPPPPTAPNAGGAACGA